MLWDAARVCFFLPCCAAGTCVFRDATFANLIPLRVPLSRHGQQNDQRDFTVSNGTDLPLPKLLDSFRLGILLSAAEETLDFPLGEEGDANMLGLLALVLIVLWLLGFLAFHVSASMIHLLLVVGLILLILHFVRGGTRTA